MLQFMAKIPALAIPLVIYASKYTLAIPQYVVDKI